MVCPNCGATVPEEARFCPNCGSPLGEPAAEERKLVTVVFADLAGSTELATHLDAERYREVMQAFYQTVSGELASLRGRAEKFVGDAVMAVFGLPHAHDDDALRAVRAGLIIRDRTERLGEVLGLPVKLRVRVGVNSGAVSVGPGTGDQPLVVGAGVNMAARLQQAAEPGEVLAGETTVQLTREFVRFGDPRRIAAKGFEEEIDAYAVLDLAPRSARRTIPIVGRSRELALLTDAYRRVRETSRPHLFTVLGEPGIGKTRLADEFLATLPEEVEVLSGAAGWAQDEGALGPLADILRRELGVERGAPREDVARKLSDLVDGCCEPTERERVAAQLGLVLGLGEEPREDRPYRVAEVRAGVVALLEGLSRGSCVVVILDDLQLAPGGLLELLDQIVRQARRLPLLLLALGREELLENAPTWGGGVPDAVTVRLDPLSEDEALDLATAAGESIDRRTAERIAVAAGGNPFFIVEATGMYSGGFDPVDAPHSHRVPPTVQAVVASRIDHLPPEARELLRRASVFARSTFHEDDLKLIAEQDGRILEVLEREELVVRDRDRAGVWRFRHEMLRDVAYESLAKRERLRLHLTLADELGQSKDLRDLRATAYHLEQAANASLDLDPTDRSVADRAVDALSHAGDKARRGIESRVAIDLYERALALAGPSEGWGEREAWILSGIGEARYWLGEFEDAAVSLQRALDLDPDNAWTIAHAARFLGDIELSVRRDSERAHELFGRALTAARELDDAWVMARVLLMAGWEPYWRGEDAEAEAVFREALEIARANPEEDGFAEARALTFLAAMRSGKTDEAEVLEIGQEALDVARKLGDPFSIAVAQERVGTSLRRMGNYKEAFGVIDEAVRTLDDLDARWELASVIGERAMVRRFMGHPVDAERDLRQSLAIVRELKDTTLLAWIIRELVEALLDRGELDEARRFAAETATEVPEDDLGGGDSPFMIETLLLLAEGDVETAREPALRVLEAHRSAAPNVTAATTWFVGRVFGPDAVGGKDALEQARRHIEAVRWVNALEFPDRVLARTR
jgi:class 3 adenylate cyclase/tetratricopeptide (TPR) repeat protein